MAFIVPGQLKEKFKNAELDIFIEESLNLDNESSDLKTKHTSKSYRGNTSSPPPHDPYGLVHTLAGLKEK